MGSSLSTGKLAASLADTVAEPPLAAATVTVAASSSAAATEGTSTVAASSSDTAANSTTTAAMASYSIASNVATATTVVASSSKAAEPAPASGPEVSENANMGSASRVLTYDVFLSFRGEDVRNSFVSYLYKALTEKGIRTFKDDVELDKGETITPALLRAIEDSRFCVVVLSKKYADSTFCLDELVKITKRIPDPKKDTKTDEGIFSKTSDLVLPIFYNVDPSEVRKITGGFGEGFDKSKPKFPEKVEGWTLALRKAGNISGWDTRTRDEVALIDEIVIYILKKLSRKSSNSTKGLVGMDSRIREMKSKLHMGSKDVSMIGIWGMGGYGKTTIARAVYDRICSEFDSCCFLESVREVAGKPGLGLSHLQEQLVSKLLKEGIQTIRSLGDNFDVIKDRFQYLRVLVVLDDVDELKQLKALAGEHKWFGPASRIIITTRNKQLLVAHGVDQIYVAKALNDEESFRLFTQYALKNCHSTDEFIELSKLSRDVIKYAKNVPLALEVLGGYLVGKNKLEWQDELHQLKISPPSGINDVLKRSFDGLHNRFQKDMFLDIACFFKGEDIDYVVKVFEVQQMGKEIVSPPESDPGRWTRLWDHNDVHTLLANNMVAQEVVGIILDLSKIENLHIHTEVLERMTKLRLLKVCYTHQSGSFEYLIPKQPFANISLSKGANEARVPLDSNVTLSRDFVTLPSGLRCLYWHGYPFETLPLHFYPQNLVELNMSYSSITEFWTEMKKFDKLKFIKLSHSQKLIRTPVFTGMPNLEVLILQGCTNLIEVHSSVGSLVSLKLLNLKDCSNLQNFPSEIRTSSLEILILSGCSKLAIFPKIECNMEHLSELHLDDTAIQELPSSIEKLTGLVLLSARNCKHLQHLPSNFGTGLKHVRSIYFSGCSYLNRLLEKLELLENLEELDVGGTTITQPPLSICSLARLKVLSFHRCEGFLFVNIRGTMKEELNRKNIRTYFYSSLSHLTSLDLSYCNLEEASIPEEFGMLYSLKKLDLSGNNFFTLPSQTFAKLENLEAIYLADCNSLVSLPSLPSSVNCIEAPDCPGLVRIFAPRIRGLCMSGFNFINCFRLGNDNATTVAVELLRHHIREVPFHSFAEFTIIVPGSEIPLWSKLGFKGSSAGITVPGHWFGNTLRGLSLWAVLEVDDHNSLANSNNDMQFCLEFYLMHDDCKLFSDTGFILNRASKIKSDHLWLRYIPSCTFKMTRVLHKSTYLKAVLHTHGEGLRVKTCGLFPMCWDENITSLNFGMKVIEGRPQNDEQSHWQFLGSFYPSET